MTLAIPCPAERTLNSTAHNACTVVVKNADDADFGFIASAYRDSAIDACGSYTNLEQSQTQGTTKM